MQFSCDYCGASISLKDKSCPQCGSVFAFVRCSNCQYNGESNEFRKGCPKCGSKNIVTKKNEKADVRYQKLRARTRNKRVWFWVSLASLLAIDVILFLYVGSSF